MGLCASIMLSYNGVSSLLVERHSGTSPYPKARALNSRTMEIFRQLGIETDVRRISLPPEDSGYAVWMKTLADGRELSRKKMIAVGPDESYNSLTPTPGCTSSQDILEPLLLRAAQSKFSASSNSQISFDTELVDLEQNFDGVSVVVTNHKTMEKKIINAKYVIAADGASSRVRDILGIRMVGADIPGFTINILFRADISRYIEGRSINMCIIRNQEAPEARGVLAKLPVRDLWYFQASAGLALGHPSPIKEGYSPERCKEIIRKVVGEDDIDLEVIRAVPWSTSAKYAERFAAGRVFLAGDAAHLMPVTGGFAMNTGIQEVHNLTWKIAMSVNGFAGTDLLASYSAEREPTGRWTVEEVFNNFKSLRLEEQQAQKNVPPASRLGVRPEYFNELGLIFGASYESTAVVPDGSREVQTLNRVTDYTPTARPGHRVPHLWFIKNDWSRVSTTDLIGPFMLLLCGDEGVHWLDAATEIADRLPVKAHMVGHRGDLYMSDNSSWPDAFGINLDGALLVRPDGYVAWRKKRKTEDCGKEMLQSLNRILSIQS